MYILGRELHETQLQPLHRIQSIDIVPAKQWLSLWIGHHLAIKVTYNLQIRTLSICNKTIFWETIINWYGADIIILLLNNKEKKVLIFSNSNPNSSALQYLIRKTQTLSYSDIKNNDTSWCHWTNDAIM